VTACEGAPGDEGRRFGGLLRQRDFCLFWTGETVNQLGSAMALMGVPLLAVLFLHATTFEVGLLAAAAYLPWLVVGLPAGAWVDRLPPRPVMIACDAASAALYASVPVAYAIGVLTIGQLLAVQLLAGAAGVVFGTAYQVNLPSLVAPGELAEGNAKLQASSSAAALGGRGLSGVVTQFVGATAALAFNAASFLVSAACLLAIRAPDPRPAAPRQASTLRRDVAEGMALVFRDRYLRPLTLFGGLANFALDAFAALVVVFLVRVVGLTAVVGGRRTPQPRPGGPRAGSPPGHHQGRQRPGLAARHGRRAAVRAADPPGCPGTAAGVLCRRGPDLRDGGDHGQHHRGDLLPGLLPAGHAGPGHRHEAVCGHGHQPFRCAGRGCAGYLARSPHRAMGRAVHPGGLRNTAARPRFHPPPGPARHASRIRPGPGFFPVLLLAPESTSQLLKARLAEL
jgi:hypothetical protein